MGLEEIIASIKPVKKEPLIVTSNLETPRVKDNLLRQKEELKSLESILKKVPKANRILDLGCSLGYTTLWLNENRGMAVGVDDDPVIIKKAKEANNYEHFYCDNFEKLNFKDNNFDVVWSYDSLKRSTNLAKALSEVFRVTNNLFFLIIPLYGLGLGEVEIFKWQPSSIQEVENQVKSVGFKILESEQIDILEKFGNLNSRCKNQLAYIKGKK